MKLKLAWMLISFLSVLYIIFSLMQQNFIRHAVAYGWNLEFSKVGWHTQLMKDLLVSMLHDRDPTPTLKLDGKPRNFWRISEMIMKEETQNSI